MPKFKNQSGGGPHNPPFKFGGMLAANRALRNKAQAKAQGGTAVPGRPRRSSSRSMMGIGNIGAGQQNRPVGMFGAMAAGAGANRNVHRPGGGGFSAFFKRKRDRYAK